MYALIDCNNFFASCERVFKPHLRNKPIAILSNNDGCVIARSDEAKALNLPMGAPAFKYESFFKKHNVHVFSSNYPLYGDMSKRVINILEQYTPNIEPYSIDEAFLHFKKFSDFDFQLHGETIRNQIYDWTGIPTSVGIAPTKALAKVANKIARKFPKETNNVFVITTDKERIKALKWTKIESVWGVGRRLSKRLKSQQIMNAYQFSILDDEWVLGNFSITELNLKKDLQGIPTLQLENHKKNKKAIATTRSFESTYSDIQNLKERVSTFAVSCASKLRRQESLCTMMIVQLQSDYHKKNTEQFRKSECVTFPYPTDSSLVISKYAVKAVEQLFKPDIHYKRAGVIVVGLVPKKNHQLGLYGNQNPKHTPLMNAIDKLNRKLGDYKIKLANQDLERTWKMRQERLSPRYTTHIDEIITVK